MLAAFAVRPFKRLAQQTRQIEAGDEDPDIDVRGATEAVGIHHGTAADARLKTDQRHVVFFVQHDHHAVVEHDALDGRQGHALCKRNAAEQRKPDGNASAARAHSTASAGACKMSSVILLWRKTRAAMRCRLAGVAAASESGRSNRRS